MSALINPEEVQQCQHCGAQHLGVLCPRCGRRNDKPEPEPKAEEPSRMNKTEQRYAALLDWQVSCGDIKAHAFEGLTFRLAQRTRYTPDFLIVLPEGRLELHEVKGGFVRDDARVKFKVAREMFPWFGWRMMQWKKGGWRQIG